MKAFEPYVRVLESLASHFLNLNTITDQDYSTVEHALNGQPSKVLRRLIPLSELRGSGVFFTNSYLAEQLTELITSDIEQGKTIYDPACGVGDLLLACARHFPILEDLEATLENWGYRLKGADLYPQFIKATKTRLLLLAIRRGAKIQNQIPPIERLFPEIQVRDTFTTEEESFKEGCIVINPPYTMIQAPSTCTWTSGLVCQAALFLEKYVENASSEIKIAAILPDVLRTGTRYIKWREHIEKYAKIEELKLAGCFDALTDVDIFICKLQVDNKSFKTGADWWISDTKLDKPFRKVDDYFEVRVGPVVPHRHPLEGPSYPYIHAQGLPTWESIEANFTFRNFSGTTFIPPFVVVRRTSRPSDKYRAIGTIIIGKNPVAVENHLVVLKPRSNSVEDCFRLLENFRQSKTNDWLNERIRCRHLTVTALRDLPWWSENEF